MRIFPTDLVYHQPVLSDVGLIVRYGHSITYTQHAEKIQVPVVLKQSYTYVSLFLKQSYTYISVVLKYYSWQLKCPNLVLSEEIHKLIYLLPGDAIHDLPVVPDQFHDHLGNVQTDVTLKSINQSINHSIDETLHQSFNILTPVIQPSPPLHLPNPSTR